MARSLFAGAVTGSGSALINGTGDVEFGAASSNGTKFAAGSTGDLVLDDFEALYRHNLGVRYQYDPVNRSH